MIIQGHEIDTLLVELDNADTGRYRLLWLSEDKQFTRFIAHCFGYQNTLDAAHALASGVVGNVTHPSRRPTFDSSEFA